MCVRVGADMVAQLHAKVCLWLVQLDAVCAPTQAGKSAAPAVADVLRHRSEVLLQGLLMANASGRLFRDLLSLHLYIEKRTCGGWGRVHCVRVPVHCEAYVCGWVRPACIERSGHFWGGVVLPGLDSGRCTVLAAPVSLASVCLR